MMFKQVVLGTSVSLSAGVSAARSEDASARFPPPDQVVQSVDEKLSLSADQKTAIGPLIAQHQFKMKASLAQANAGTLQRKHKLARFFGDSDAKIQAVLTPDQQQRYAAIERQMIEQMKQRMQSN